MYCPPQGAGMRYKEHVSKRWFLRATHRVSTHGNGLGTTSEFSQSQEAADHQCPFPSRTRGFLALLLDNSSPHLQKSGKPLSSGSQGAQSQAARGLLHHSKWLRPPGWWRHGCKDRSGEQRVCEQVCRTRGPPCSERATSQLQQHSQPCLQAREKKRF